MASPGLGFGMVSAEDNPKFALQEDQYEFPYHYLPHLKDGSAKLSRRLRWGRDYLCMLLSAAEWVKDLAPATLLDIGCGDGRFIGFVKDHVCKCQGMDLSGKAIGFAKAFHPSADFKVGDAAQLREQYDCVTALEVLEHVPDDDIAFFVRTLADRCRENGRVVVCVPTVNVPLSSKHYRHYDLALLDAHMGDRFVRERDQFLVPVSKWERRLERTLNNRLVRVEIPALEEALWKRAWQNRLAEPSNGAHLLAQYRLK